MSSEFALFKETELKFSPVLLNVSEGFVYSLGGFFAEERRASLFILGSTAFCGGSSVVFSGVLGKAFLTLVLVTEAELRLSQLVAALYFWGTRAGRTPGPAGGESSREQKHCWGLPWLQGTDPGAAWGSGFVPGH